MPSFLSKVFGSSKSKKHSPTDTNPHLLGGKFEAVSPTVSPSAEKFSEGGKSKNRDKDKDNSAFSTMFRSKSRPNLPSSPSASNPSLKSEEPPHLSLRLDTENGRNGVKDVFAEDVVLSESAIMEKRLSPEEVTQLVRACKEAIFSRGLETLGIMHPHWHSTSPELQQRLISLFLRSITSTPSSPASSKFTSELQEARDPHDVAAVLRWALRHLQHPSNSSSSSSSRLESNFGITKDWYPTFSSAEAAQNYPANAYTSILAPLLPEANATLLGEVLEVVSALAPLAEKNSTSAARLSMIFGLWLLAEDPRVRKGDSWKEFYERWEVMGRMLEHLFLVRVRDEASGNRLPTRLLDLVKSYPYGTSPSPDGLLPRTRFSTRRHSALFVRVETEVSSRYKEIHGKKRLGPRALLSRALAAQVIPAEGEIDEGERALWTLLKGCKKSEDGDEDLGSVFADETLRLFELLEQPRGRRGREGQVSPTFSVFPSGSTRSPVVRTYSERDTLTSTASPSSNGHSKYATDSALQTPTLSPTTAASSVIVDWAQFSTAGFGDAATQNKLAETLWDEEVEKTAPPKLSEFGSVVSRIRSRSRSRSRTRTKKSAEVPQEEKIEKEEVDEKLKKSRVVQVSSVLLDEAFVDFWSDTLTDSVVTREWPEFIVCKLKSTVSPPGQAESKKTVDYLVLEHSYTVPLPPPPPPAEAVPRASSPRPSVKDKKRFSFFSSSTSGRPSIGGRGHSGSASSVKNRLGGGSKAKVGEMGEVLKEADEEKPTTVKVKVPVPKGRKSLAKEDVEKAEKEAENSTGNGNGNGKVVAAAGAGVVAGAAAAAAVDAAPAALAEVKPAEEDVTPKADDKAAPTVDVSGATDVVPEETAAPAPEPIVENAEESEVAEAPVVEQPAVVEEPVTPAPVEATEPAKVEAPTDAAPVESAPAPVEEVVPAATETIPAELAPSPIVVVQPEETVTATSEPVIEKAEESEVAEVAVVEQPAAVEPEPTTAPEPVVQPTEAVEAAAPAEEAALAEVVPVEPQPEEPVVEQPAVADEAAPARSESVVEAPAKVGAAFVPEPIVEQAEEEVVADAPAPVVEEPPAQEATEEPKAESPVESAPVEKPVVAEAVEEYKEVIVDAPVVEQPAVEEPSVPSTEPAAAEPAAEEANEEVVADAPAADAKPDADVDETPVAAPEEAKEETPIVENETPVVAEPAAPVADEVVSAPVVAEMPSAETEVSSSADETAADVAGEVVESNEDSAAEPESNAIATDKPTYEAPQEPAASRIVAEVDVSPPTNADPTAPTTIAVMQPTPTQSFIGNDYVETTARAAGPEAIVERVPLAEDAKDEPSHEPEAVVEAVNGNGAAHKSDDVEGDAASEPPVEQSAPVASDNNETVAEVAANTEEAADESTPKDVPEEEVPTISVEAETPAAEVPSPEAAAVDAGELTDAAENVVSATPRIEPLPVEEVSKVEEALVDLPAVPLVEAVIPPSDSPEDVYVSVPVTEPEPSASTEHVDATPAPKEELAEPEVAAAQEDELPPAPESVVLAGSTPGPALALSTSEPAALEALTKDEAVTESSEVPSSQTNGKHVEQVNDSDAPPNGSNHEQETVEPTNADKD